jgi:hypothetical protein
MGIQWRIIIATRKINGAVIHMPRGIMYALYRTRNILEPMIQSGTIPHEKTNGEKI